MTCRVSELHRAFLEAVLFIHSLDTRARDLRRGDRAKVAFCRGEAISIVEMCSRNCPSQGLAYVPFFDAVQLVNKLTLDAADPLSKETGFKKCAVKLEKVQAIMSRSAKPQNGRHRFLRDVARTADGLAAVGVALGSQQQIARASGIRLRPPGAVNGNAFASARARCGQYVQACPYDTLKLATLVSGLSAGTLYFVARGIPCEVREDIPCAKVCPSSVSDRGIESINDARMGLAVLMDQENCLSFQGLCCDVCYRECPKIDEATTLESERNTRTDKHARFLPTVYSDVCTGCGKCEKVCVLERPAIKVLPPSLAKGELGRHYCFGWLEGNNGKS